MEQNSDGNLALKLSVEVLKRNICLDEGLVRAQTTGMVEPFVEGLNVLVGQPIFNLEEFQRRLRTGAAERAIRGEEELLPLPSELDGWTLDDETHKAPLDKGDFVNLETQAEKLLSHIEEIRSRIVLIDTAIHEEERIPNPWIAPLVLLVLTVSTFLTLRFGLNSIPASGLALALGAILCLISFQKEMKRFQTLNRKVRTEILRRKHLKEKCLAEIELQRKELMILQGKADDILAKSELPEKEELDRILEEFPALFHKGRGD